MHTYCLTLMAFELLQYCSTEGRPFSVAQRRERATATTRVRVFTIASDVGFDGGLAF